MSELTYEAAVAWLQDSRPATYLAGSAGTGKSWVIQNLLQDCFVVATTAAAALNLGSEVEARTLASALGFGIVPDISDWETRGVISDRLHRIKRHHRALVIDECSMLPPAHLDVIFEECRKVGLPLYLVGDFAQLPPVDKTSSEVKMATQAKCWKYFEANTLVTPLPGRAHLCRQGSDPAYKAALDVLRTGDGERALPLMIAAGVQFTPDGSVNFKGLTVFCSNEKKDNFNVLQYEKLIAAGYEERVYTAVKKGVLTETLRNIPNVLKLTRGCKVVVQGNAYLDGSLLYCNGDAGTVIEARSDEVSILRHRGNVVVTVIRTTLENVTEFKTVEDKDGITHRVPKTVVGSVNYLPLELGWASTVHSAQGVTVEAVQLDIRKFSMAHPSMIYVAASRCKTGKDVRIIGTHEEFKASVISPFDKPSKQRWFPSPKNPKNLLKYLGKDLMVVMPASRRGVSGWQACCNKQGYETQWSVIYPTIVQAMDAAHDMQRVA